jgi:hypothetical protein
MANERPGRAPIALALAMAGAALLGAACTVGDEGGGDHTGGASNHTMDGGGGSGIDADTACAASDPTPYMCPCQLEDDTCAAASGDLCWDFRAKGAHCTHACEVDGDCPAPSAGCNDKGVCKAPD